MAQNQPLVDSVVTINWQLFSRLETAVYEAPRIYYVNALPGTGKTHRFIHDVAIPHVRNRHNTVLVYAAPTERLLDEVEQLLIRQGVPNTKLWRISSQDSDEIPVGDRFVTALVGSRRNSVKPIPNGSILLCTHECIARIPIGAPGRNRVTLVYDEARACLQDNYSIRLPEAIYKFFTSDADHGFGEVSLINEQSVYKDGQKVMNIWDWRNRNIPLPRIEELEELLPPSNMRRARCEKIMHFIENVYSSSIDVYVNVRIEQKQGRTEYVVYNVFSPVRMFSGYNKVLILSAFFESSQMYHFLKSPRAHDLASTPATLLNVTGQYIYRDRLAQVVKRLSDTRITYVFDREVELTKTDIQVGLVADRMVPSTVQQQLSAKWKSIFVNRAETYRTAYVKYRHSVKGSQRVSSTDRTPVAEFFKACRGITLESPVRYMVETALALHQEHARKNRQPCTTLPVAITQKYSSSGEYSGTVWQQESLDQISYDSRNQLPNGAPVLAQLRMVSHGLNAYKNMDGCAFLASMKYSPEECLFLRHIVPDYNPAVDRTLDYAIQVLWRCSVRNTDRKNKALLIVTDNILAVHLRTRVLLAIPKAFHSQILPIVVPQSIYPEWKNATILKYEEVYDAKANKAKVDTYRATDSAKLAKQHRSVYEKQSGYATLSARVTYYRKLGDYDKAQELIDQRKQLISYAHWKHTPDGVKEWNRLRQTTTAYDKVRTVITSNKLWAVDRKTRLGLVLAVKSLGFKPEQVSGYNPESLARNWSTSKVWSNGDAAAFILRIAKSQGVPF